MQGALAATALRVAGGLGIVACAAVIALAAGGGSVFGGLGGLFGSSGPSLEVSRAGERAADIVAAPSAAARAAARTRRMAALRRLAPKSRSGAPQAPRRLGGVPRHESPSPAPGPLRPAPSPAPQLPPPSRPAPGGGQTVSTVGQAVKQVTSQAPPQLQPLTKPVNDAVNTLVQTCQGLPACP